ncbi:helix-turn-helix domain-containing protein [Rhizobium sp. GCM10022189]|uniref:helix-turn-helix domain-containing protein n=1 Tax=Rhizobium sp. GCM10022189 TaxID=3252654 RepID=UPI0036116562
MVSRAWLQSHDTRIINLPICTLYGTRSGNQALERASGTVETPKEVAEEEKQMSDLNSSVGGTLEDFLAELGEKEEVYGEAIKRVLTWQIEEARKAQSITQSEMAAKMGTSRTQVKRVLDPRNVAVSLETLDRAARSVGKRLKVELVDA